MNDPEAFLIMQQVDSLAQYDKVIIQCLPPPAPLISVAVPESIMSSEGSDSDSDSDSDDDTSDHDSTSDQEPVSSYRPNDEISIENEKDVSKRVLIGREEVVRNEDSPSLRQKPQQISLHENSAFGLSYSDVRRQKEKMISLSTELNLIADGNENKELRSLKDDINDEEFDYPSNAKSTENQCENDIKALNTEKNTFVAIEERYEQHIAEELRLATLIERDSAIVPESSNSHHNEIEKEMSTLFAVDIEKELSHDCIVESVNTFQDRESTNLEGIEENEMEDADQKDTIDIPFASHKWTEIELQPVGLGTASPLVDSDDPSRFVSYTEARDDLLHDDIIRDATTVEVEAFSCLMCVGWSKSPKLCFQGGEEEYERVFCLAATPMMKKQCLSSRMLLTIYRGITDSENSQQVSNGTNWEQIGFQGSDPSTDLRSCGVLALLQMLYVVTQHPTLTRKLYQLSQHDILHYPLACTMINITRSCLQALRKKKLHNECNRRRSVLSAMNVLFASIANSVAVMFTEMQKNAAESQKLWPLMLQKTLQHGGNSPTRVMKQFHSSEHTVNSCN